MSAVIGVSTMCRGRSTPATAGFWFGDVTYQLPRDATATLGGPLTAAEIASIQQLSRDELARAFAGLRIAFTDRRDEFWRVEVRQTLRGRGPMPNSGEAIPMGMLGGAGGVNFLLVALKAIQYAPPGASREAMVDGIARGIGRVAAHEFAHVILGAAGAHNDTDRDSYEFPGPDRASQYYGELHWTVAWSGLSQTLRR